MVFADPVTYNNPVIALVLAWVIDHPVRANDLKCYRLAVTQGIHDNYAPWPVDLGLLGILYISGKALIPVLQLLQYHQML